MTRDVPGLTGQGPVGAHPLPSAHVHGVDIDPGGGDVYLATHDGLFRYAGGDVARSPQRRGPVIDLMGFAIAAPKVFYASGHPGTATPLPDPVGLIKSTDAGQTWDVRSRAGQSDFHALAATDGTAIGFDGAWAATGDEQAWSEPGADFEPYSLAASTDGRTVVATTPSGPRRSSDAGTTWRRIESAPLLMVVNWATGDTVVGVTPAGQVQVSTDGGQTWRQRGDLAQPVQAVGALGQGPGLQVVVATQSSLVRAGGAGPLTFAGATGLP